MPLNLSVIIGSGSDTCIEKQMYPCKDVWPKKFLYILIGIGFLGEEGRITHAFVPFFRQNVFNNLIFPLLPRKKFLHLMAYMKCIQKVIFMIIRAIPLGKPHYHFQLQNEDNRKRWETKKKLIKRGISRYNKAYSVFGSSSEANWKTPIFKNYHLFVGYFEWDYMFYFHHDSTYRS